MAYALKPIGDEWFETAPLVVPASVELDAPAPRVWEALGSDAMWSWAPIDRLQWTTPRPHAAGSIRRLRLFGLTTLEEEFYRWDVNRRATFRVTHQTRRVFEGLAEDFLLEPLSGGSRTRLTWTVAQDLRGIPAPPKALVPLLAKANAAAIGGIKTIL